MLDARLSIALGGGGLLLPKVGDIGVFHPPADAILSDFPKYRTRIVQPDYVANMALSRRGYATDVEPQGPYAAAVVCLPRARALAQSLVAAACAATSGPIIVDGQKTDGVDSMLKAIRAHVPVMGPVSKAHGKLFWFEAGDDFTDWEERPALTPGGFWTAPGVFSADAIDPASALLADALPGDLSGAVADLGAGWGFLSAHVLTRPDVTVAHLVEAGHMALECARRNVTDPRAQYHWADATTWAPPAALDAVVMNPPFHTGRAADPDLGRGFIAAASGMLAPRGELWMVANRHLPYEASLSSHFAQVAEIGGDARFKILRASRPSRKRR